MFRPASRALLRTPAVAIRGPGPASTGRRLISTGPAETKSRSWKNTLVRLGLAAGAVYYYNTSSLFAETPSLSFRSEPTSPKDDDNTLPTLDSIKPRIRDEKKPAQSIDSPPQDEPTEAQPSSEETLQNASDLEEEANQEAAFNPETGEINWDCPCLGGMAHGPCGEEFKAAFSCFVYSNEEPKGIECIDKFSAMQNCFRQYPEHYGAEIDDDDEVAAGAVADAAVAEQPVAASEVEGAIAQEVPAQAKPQEGEIPQTEEVIPKAWHVSDGENKPEAEK